MAPRTAPSSSAGPDVVIAGAGPAGAVAATILARAGARVCLVDRARFPRPKLCGDTLNPGALAMLRRLGLAGEADATGLRVGGMRVTGEDGVAVEGRYPSGLYGRALSRECLDRALVDAAVSAGAQLECGVSVRAAMEDDQRDGRRVVGVRAVSSGISCEFRAPVTIAADGRHSTLAFGLGLARHPAQPRRWAMGVYATGVTGLSDCGEMHIRRGSYVGVAPLPGGLANLCVVSDGARAGAAWSDPVAAIRSAVDRDRALRERFADAQFVTPARVLGPLAVDVIDARRVPDGLILAGDAAGFIDPMTGDGLRFAIRGAELAAAAALRALESGWAGIHDQLAAQRRREFLPKWRFNRALRALVGSPVAVRAATSASRMAPFAVRALIVHAGDCGVANRQHQSVEV